MLPVWSSTPALAQDAPPGVATPTAWPAVPASIDARALGLGESQVAYCAGHDAKLGDSARRRLELSEHGLGPAQLVAMRRSDAYRAAFDAETTFLGRVDDRNATRVCDPAANRHKQR